MKRDLTKLSAPVFDVIVIGGGVFAACAARDAALRGLSVALVEKDDFGGATSSQHLKMVHGGIRYLQHADLTRLRESSAERRAWLRIAPHLVQPLPVVVPTYGWGMKGRQVLRAGMRAYDLLTWDRNAGLNDRDRRIPATGGLNRAEVLREFPHVPDQHLTGAGLFFDGQIQHPPRLVLAIIRDAVEHGAVVANHLAAVGLQRRGDRIEAVRVRDTFTADEFEIRGRIILNAAGPYSEALLQRTLQLPLQPPGVYSRDACFIVPRTLLPGGRALAVQGQTRDPDARLNRGARHLFLAPWRGHTLVGVWHVVHTDAPERINVTAAELERFITEVNAGCPALGLTLEDVAQWNAGLVPFGDSRPGDVHLRYGHRSRIVDHRPTHGIENLVTLIGLRFTTGRLEAARAVDLVQQKLGRNPQRAATDQLPVTGGDIEPYADFHRRIQREWRGRLPEAALETIARNHGSRLGEVLAAGGAAGGNPCIAGTMTTRAEVLYAIEMEMAATLADVAFRRTHLATGSYPGRAALEETARLMGERLGWDSARERQEVDAVVNRFTAWTVSRIDAQQTAEAR